MTGDGELGGTPTLAASGIDASRCDDGGPFTALSPGDVVGRYVVLSKVGEGGMGIVYAAYDPELDRRVALKLLHGADGGGAHTEGHRRLVREAQAIARLSHPNVVTVHDAGVHGRRVYLAMEFIEGTTLGGWREAKTRDWREVLEVFGAAGQGLVAAHERGLVHRDFKPDNVMVGADGRICVTDFGLARATDLTPMLEDEHGSEASGSALTSDLTAEGAVVGTPAYMAPEQHVGLVVGEAADQFSFCVALWEALYGQRPFGGETLAELAVNVTDGNSRIPPPRSRVPLWVRRVCERGLSARPGDRFPSMQALLDALARGQATVRLRRLAMGLGVGVALASGAQAYRMYEQAQVVARCDAAGESIDEVWSDGRRTSLRTALVGTGASYAQTTADKVTRWFDDHARGWASARRQACLSRETEQIWTAETHNRAVWCLDERRLEFDALVTELEGGDARVLPRATQAAAALYPVDACLDADVLSRISPPPARHRQAVHDVRARLSRAGALETVGAYDTGLAVARRALQEAETVAWSPLIAACRSRLGRLLHRSGHYAEAEAELETAFFTAAEAGAGTIAFDAAVQLVPIVGARLDRHTEAIRWSRHVEVLRKELPDPGDLRHARSLSSVATVHEAAGDYGKAKMLLEQAVEIREGSLGPRHPAVGQALASLAAIHEVMGSYAEALALNERALAIGEHALGPGHPEVARSLNNLANVHDAKGDRDRARELHQRALAMREQALGPEHPQVANSLNNLGLVYQATGDYPRAKALFERALAIREKAMGSNHPAVAQALNNLATVYQATAAHDEARALLERALAIWERTLGPDHDDLAMTLSNLAALHQLAEEWDEAIALNERARAIWARALGPEHPSVATSLGNLGLIYIAKGDDAKAREMLERSLAIWEKALGPEHPIVAHPLAALSDVALTQGRLDDAVALAERAVALREGADVPAAELAAAHTVLARVRWAQGERAEGVALATRARDAYRELGPAGTRQLEEVEHWLERHRAR